MSFITTYTGKSFDIIAATPDDLDIEDIAAALSKLCRWGGHTKVFYSVAEHSIHVASMLPESLALAGLLHDAAEAYVGDVIGPLKGQNFMSTYRLLEWRFLDMIDKKFKVDTDHDKVKAVDLAVLRAEELVLIKNQTGPAKPVIRCWTPEEARVKFMQAFYFMGGKR